MDDEMERYMADRKGSADDPAQGDQTEEASAHKITNDEDGKIDN